MGVGPTDPSFVGSSKVGEMPTSGSQSPALTIPGGAHGVAKHASQSS